MKQYSFYQKDSGAIHHVLFQTDDDGQLKNNTPPDHIAIEGAHDHRNKRVNVATGEVIDYQPPAPSDDHEWNAETKFWQVKTAVLDKQNKRSHALYQIAALEASQQRVIRELVLNLAGTKVFAEGELSATRDRLHDIDTKIQKFREDL
jgi:hypothetical protein